MQNLSLEAREAAEDFLLTRILPNIEITTDGCWEWQRGLIHGGKRGGGRKAVNPGGYGVMRFQGKVYKVHRLVAMITKSIDIPPTLYVCHTCDNPKCCNPEHLWLGTPKENVQDMIEKGRYRNGKESWTHCKYGHEFTPENTYLIRNGKNRRCKKCVNGHNNKRYHDNKGKKDE